MRVHLRPRGILAVDFEVGGIDTDSGRTRRVFPADDSPPAEEVRRLGPDGFHYALRHRVIAVDPTTGRVTRELKAWRWRGGALVGFETQALIANLYSSDEIVAMLEDAGFVDIRIVGGYHGDEPTGDERFLVYLATAPLSATANEPARSETSRWSGCARDSGGRQSPARAGAPRR